MPSRFLIWASTVKCICKNDLKNSNICLYRDDQQFYEINKSVSTIQTKMAGLSLNAKFSLLSLLIFFIIISPPA